MSLPFIRRARRVGMRYGCFFGLFAIAALSARPGIAQSVVPGGSSENPASEARIRAIIAEQVVAWNAGDAKSILTAFR
jgi:hypothetical protein